MTLTKIETNLTELPHETHGGPAPTRIVVAYVVARPGRQPAAEALMAHCLAQLADYKKPRRLHLVDSLPLTPVGKISRAALRERARTAS